MSKRCSSLTGAWSGAYRYPDGAETVFNAQIEDGGGAFFGTTQEPNQLDHGPAVLMADIEGVRSGGFVSFTKFYHTRDWYAIRYEGAVDEALRRIDGRWTIPRSGSGTFFMVRDDEGEVVEAAAAIEVEARG